MIQGYRWILVDEYQDTGPAANQLIAAVAGRSSKDPDLQLSLFAVDQGQTLGKMARNWSPPAGASFLRGEVGAVVR